MLEWSSKLITARIISIGNELLGYGTVNSNGAELSTRLEGLGIKVRRIISVGDEEEEIVQEINHSEETVLILTGGLGPTEDDRTVPAVARALGVSTVIDPDHLKHLEKIRRTRNLPEQFLKQAVVPQGFTVAKSPYGTAPFLYRSGNKKPSSKKSSYKKSIQLLVILPGVPFECLSLFDKKVAPLIKKNFKPKRRGQVQEIKIISVPESVVEEALTTIRNTLHPNPPNHHSHRGADDGVEASFLPSLGELLVRLRGDDPVYLKTLARRLVAAFTQHRSYLSPINRSIPSVRERLHRFLIAEKWRVGFVESCTGGLLTSGFVSFPGSSSYLDAGAITYSDQAKIDLCGVKATTLKKFGAVSSNTAEEMAAGWARRRKLNLCVSVTGIAGPGGSTPSKPVGLVYIGLYCRPPGAKTPYLISREFFFGRRGGKKGSLFLSSQNRNRIQERAVKNALFLMMEACFPSSNLEDK